MSISRFIRINAIAAAGLAPSRPRFPRHCLSPGSSAFDGAKAGKALPAPHAASMYMISEPADIAPLTAQVARRRRNSIQRRPIWRLYYHPRSREPSETAILAVV